jgi:hypothetical protein
MKIQSNYMGNVLRFSRGVSRSHLATSAASAG